MAMMLAVVSVASAMTASNTVPPSGLGMATAAVAAGDFRPPECAAIQVANLIVGSGGATTGTSASDHIIGMPGNDVINGGQGHDCLDGNGGTDTINGGPGTDVCIGSPASRFQSCEVVVTR